MRILQTFLLLGAAAIAAAQPPAAPKRPVIDTYHGVQVKDDYRWLEDFSNPEVKAWSDAENAYARKYLDGLSQRAACYEEIRKVVNQTSASYYSLQWRAGMWFVMKQQPPKEQPVLVWMRSVDEPDDEHIIVDPNAIDNKGGSSIDFYVPSLDGKRVAVSISKGGSESGDIHVYDTGTGKETSDLIPRVNGGTAGGSLTWNADGSGFWYTRYPRAGERPAADLDFYQQVYFHKLGAKPEADTYALGKDFPRIAEISLLTSPDGRYVMARMANGDGGEFAHYLRTPSGEWKQITRYADEISEAEFGAGDVVYLLSRHNAPMGQVLQMPLANPQLERAKVLAPESKLAIRGLAAAGRRLYVMDQAGGPSQVRVFRAEGGAGDVLPLPPVAGVAGAAAASNDTLMVRISTYLAPPVWQRYDPTTKKLAPTGLRESGAADFSDSEVVREFATSRDGTKVPLNVIRRKGTKLDGSNPVLLIAYGGYGISLGPFYDAGMRPYLDHNVVYVIANLRGGGEYGEAWHRAGMLTRKQNVFDDFAAAAQWLIDAHYTTPARLAIEGGSNGGLLMGAALTQHKELFHAVVSHVGIYDMLRVELQPNGAFNVTEFGTVKEQDQFRALYGYSPYHHVEDGAQYPAILFLTGANDPRVDPSHSRKMTARLQASGTKRPVLLRTTSEAGHGIGTALSEQIAQGADVMAFLFDQWGIGGSK
jgi:prolyl oligopeptidase